MCRCRTPPHRLRSCGRDGMGAECSPLRSPSSPLLWAELMRGVRPGVSLWRVDALYLLYGSVSARAVTLCHVCERRSAALGTPPSGEGCETLRRSRQ